MHIQLMVLVCVLFCVTGCAASGGVYSSRGYERNYPPMGYQPARYPAYGVAPRQAVPVYQSPRQRGYRPAPPPSLPVYVAPERFRPPPGSSWQRPGRGYAPPPPRHYYEQRPPPRHEPRRVESRSYGKQRGWESQRR